MLFRRCHAYSRTCVSGGVCVEMGVAVTLLSTPPRSVCLSRMKKKKISVNRS